ncbi:hypothetical protein [Asticcacaulis excentricus]|uniref:DUF4164 family protein n=1 Tax=Asticcacaulis excentricus (strain ATCC 15261 / DSM 4724 / KCTC 12464 / NCIMB 9791 / VKM B-1370 / CB 48) TaxID=573065 RepID=E8RQT1_ASTEC|nr:hypothetical protein [Asticcacaulis excentricus]ADU13309.1 hypothetical protein Astex_1643 [Asticcacaulis excentricus CB 48]
MENAQNTAQLSPVAGASLTAAVERLDSALNALEIRIRDLHARSVDPQGDSSITEARRLQDEIGALKAREKALEAAASEAFEALGMAAEDIRQLLNEQAA